VCALPLRILIEEQHAKIEPAIKKFQQECSGHTDSQACKEGYDHASGLFKPTIFAERLRCVGNSSGDEN
jgi:hypothetical protein